MNKNNEKKKDDDKENNKKKEESIEEYENIVELTEKINYLEKNDERKEEEIKKDDKIKKDEKIKKEEKIKNEIKNEEYIKNEDKNEEEIVKDEKNEEQIAKEEKINFNNQEIKSEITQKENNIINNIETNSKISEPLKESIITTKNMYFIEDLKSIKPILSPTITKFHLTKSSSFSNVFLSPTNISNSKDILSNLNAKEIRFKDIFEKSKRFYKKYFKFKNQKDCFKCNIKDLPKENYITFNCGHKICQECLIKDLLLLKFKNLENTKKIKFNCFCMIGSSPSFPYPEFIEVIKKINESKQQSHYCINHKNNAIKYCKDCELWLCDECLNIHEVFNKHHILSEKGVRPKLKCKLHTNEFTQFYCLQCNEEICTFCLTKIGKHIEHKTIHLEKLEKLGEEIKYKLRFKTYDDCVENLENIREKNINEKNKKIEEFQLKIKNLIENLRLIEEKYINEINEKINYLNYVIDVMKESYKYFYLMLSKEKKTYTDITFLSSISEINNIKSFYLNYEEFSEANKLIDKFGLNNKLYYYYEINIDKTIFEYSAKFEKIFNKKLKINQSIEENKKEIRIKSKYILPIINYSEIKPIKKLNTKNGNIYSICKINKDEIAIACDKEIYILSNLNFKIYDSIDKYPSLIGHTKNIICMTLLNGYRLASAEEEKIIKIWDISEKKLISTISKNYKRINSLFSYKDNCLIIGAYNSIKIININTKEELMTLLGHEKSICCIIEISHDIIATSSYDNSIKVWDLNKKDCEFTLYGHDSPVFCILILRDGRLISGSGSKDKALKVWNLDKKICEFSLIGHKREVRDIKQLINGLVVTASMDKTIKVWNLFKKICVQTLVLHSDVVFSLCVIDKNRFISGGRDPDIIIWKY